MESVRRSRPVKTKAVAVLSLALVGLAGCGKPGVPLPGRAGDPKPAAQALVEGLNSSDLSGVPATLDAQAELREIFKGMDSIQPRVTAGEVQRSGNAATVPLTWSWPFATGAWEYPTTATLRWAEDRWVLDWDPKLVQPQLTSDTRLVHNHSAATRGRIIGKNGVALAEEMPVSRLGIDKSQVDAATAERSARELAEFADINADNFVAKVKAAGEKAFVEAIVLRPDDARDGWEKIPGAASLQITRTLPVSREFAPEILGTMGEPTPEQIKASDNNLFVGDSVGISGLQKRWDDLLRGHPGTKVTAVPRTTSAGTASPTPGSTPTASPTPLAKPLTLFEAPAVKGGDVATSFDPDLQMRAEQTLVPVQSAAALVAVQPSTGKVLAAATSAGSKGNPDATFGRYAPGSTFKVVTALALLRSGMTPETKVNCTENVTVDGRTFKNYNEFPSDKVGSVTLSEALAYSCNTALIAEHQRISPEALRDAAASLGLGQDYDAGFSSFFGSLPNPNGEVGKSESLIGQGSVETSPMAMAAVAASVQSGRTVVPWLLDEKQPPAPAKPLTADEAAALQKMMKQTVSEGTAKTLNGTVEGAKTGTAEYGTAVPPKTNAWMIAYKGDLAVAVLVTDGASGSKDAGPLIQKFLRG